MPVDASTTNFELIRRSVSFLTLNSSLADGLNLCVSPKRNISTLPAFTCSKLTIETLEQVVSLLLTLKANADYPIDKCLFKIDHKDIRTLFHGLHCLTFSRHTFFTSTSIFWGYKMGIFATNGFKVWRVFIWQTTFP